LASPVPIYLFRANDLSVAAEIVTVGLAKDYHCKNSAAGFWVYDYRLQRILAVQAESRLINDALYAEIRYRRAELENRAMINGVMQKAGIDAAEELAANTP
jgi:hypothetical protein